jgi:hypothetical protein
VVIIQVVTNDFVYGVSLGSFRASYETLLQRVGASSPRAQLVCLGAWDPPGSSNPLGLTAADYDAAVRSSCGGKRGSFVPLSSVFVQPGVRGPAGQATPFGTADTFHPNDMGQVLIAGDVLAGLDRDPSSGATSPAQLDQAGPARREGDGGRGTGSSTP